MAGRRAAAQLLVKHGAAVDAVTANGMSPLQVAVEHQNLSCARFLRMHICTISAPQSGALHGETASNDDDDLHRGPWFECTMEALR